MGDHHHHHYQSPFASDSRTLPRAIPNAHDAPPPGIPSMEAPASIFGDYRHRLPSLPAVDFQSGTPLVERGKSGISSLRDRMNAFDAMHVDRHQPESSLGGSPYPMNGDSSRGFSSRFGRDEFRPHPVSSVASTNELSQLPSTFFASIPCANFLFSSSSLSEAMRKTFDAYDKGLVQKLNSPVSSATTSNGLSSSSYWSQAAPFVHRSEERNGSISSQSSFTPSYSKDRSPKLPSVSDITSIPPSPAIPEPSSQWPNPTPSGYETGPRSGYHPFGERDRSPGLARPGSSLLGEAYDRDRRTSGFSISSGYAPDRPKVERVSPEGRGDDDIIMDDAPPRSTGTPFEYRKSPVSHPSPGPRYAKFRSGPYSPREERYSSVSEARSRFFTGDNSPDLNRVTMTGDLNFTSQSGPARTSVSSPRTPYGGNGVVDSAGSPSPYSRGHQRTISEADRRQQASEAAVGPKHHSAPKLLGVLMCECCPKKPKKFDNQLDLKMHEMEKQYGCKYCTHRFKNKNEAERHQNSLHLRKHSWCCSAIASTPEAAFHPSPVKQHYVDICGYCGEEFANPPDWQARHDHLSEVHKFGECNQNKKFFRADHFRQHLKHTHAGTSGKWANVLENACKREVPEHEQHPDPVIHGGMMSDMMD
ncbi:hypothetical protein Dda_8076 [Drechslerella dactyloides]|uniref:C2H2-type domain-containing protein n=1 Tax=Drechslerella dactyloides TaxID=74499 RepID=A0AAD6ISV5_DREDA|nr:hypothetical protein Dda_9481 [Drechslerella dactyloides]KAJ6257190.1 hypothetical protein Dda_8076 [Drechslerella dactyloides]